MNHETTFAIEAFETASGEAALRLSWVCSCGWSCVNERPDRPGRADEMAERMAANHAAWRATPRVAAFERSLAMRDADTRARIEAAMKEKAPQVAEAMFGGAARAGIEAIAKAEGLPSIWPHAVAAGN